MSNIQLFEHEKFGQVRITNINNEPWFVAKDVAEALGYVKPENAISRHCRKATTTPKQGGGYMTIIPESDVYRLVMRSHLEAAEKFEEWVTSEVLPSIRKHGAYMTQDVIEEALLNPDTLIRLATNLKEEREKRQTLEQKIEENKPKVLFADAVSASDGTILIGELAKILKGNGVEVGQNRLFRWLRDNNFLIKRQGSDFNMPTQKSMTLGLMAIKETAITHSDGHITISKTPKVTGKGQQYFVNLFLSNKSA